MPCRLGAETAIAEAPAAMQCPAMERLLLAGAACAVLPVLAAQLRPVLGGLTRPLVWLLAAAQVLAVPVAVALDPDLDFGSDTYSLGAGLAIMLIGGVELVLVAGTAVGLLLALPTLRNRPRL